MHWMQGNWQKNDMKHPFFPPGANLTPTNDLDKQT